MRRQVSIIVAICATLWTVGLATAVPGNESELALSNIIQEVLGNNPELKAASEKWEAAKARIPQAKSLDDPQIGVEFEMVPHRTFELGNAETTMYGVSQMIPFPGKLSLRGKVASKEADMAEQQYRAKKRQILAEMKSAYYELHFVHKSIGINEENKILLSDLSRIAQSKYSVGKVSQQDVLKAQVEVSKIINELIILRQEKETAEAKLNALLNRDIRSPLGKPQEFEVASFGSSIESLFAAAVENRPELKEAFYEVERSKLALSLARLEYAPDFMVEYKQRQTNAGWDGWDGMVKVNVPLWFRTKQNYKVKEAMQDLASAESAYRGMKNGAFSQVRDLLAKVQAAERQVDLYKTGILPQAEQTFKASLAGYQTDKVDFLNLLDSQRMLLDFRLEYYRSTVDFQQRLAELEQAVGTDLIKE
jgi:outer membrane protein TolC